MGHIFAPKIPVFREREEREKGEGEEMTGIEEITVRRHVHIPWKLVDKVEEGVRRILESELYQFNPSLRAIPIAINHFEVTSDVVEITPVRMDSIYIVIEADLIVFRPQEGDELEGVIKAVADDYVSVMIYGVFNASIPKVELIKQAYLFNPLHQKWQHLQHEDMEVDQPIRIRCEQLQVKKGILSIIGTPV